MKTKHQIDLKKYIADDMWDLIKDDGRVVSALSDAALQLEGYTLEDGLLVDETCSTVADFRLLTTQVDFRRSCYKGIGRSIDKQGQKSYARLLDTVLVGVLDKTKGILTVYSINATSDWVTKGKVVSRNVFLKGVKE